jgi:hypothetical protein
MDPKGRRVRIHQEEMETLLNLKSRLDHKEAAASYVKKYQKLGGALQAVNPQDGTNLGRRVSSKDVWLNRLNLGRLFGPPFPVARSGKI